MNNLLKNCPACNSNNFISFQTIKFRTSTNTFLKKKLFFKLAHCLVCGNYFNSLFESKNINFVNPDLETFFSHNGIKKSEYNLINNLKIFFKKISFPDSILDYGCGDGSFLVALKKRIFKKKNALFLGYDIGNSFTNSDEFTSDIVTFRRFLKNSEQFYFISCRHVLEHLENVNLFFNELSNLNNFLILIEVPNGNRSISNGHFEDLHYDHVSYFSFESLKRIFLDNNIVPIHCGHLLSDENIYLIGYRFTNKNLLSNSISLIQSPILNYYHDFSKKIEKIAKILNDENSVFWGVGGRALSILNKVKFLSKKEFNCFLVDSDRSKVGQKIPGFKKNVISIDNINFNSVTRIIIGTRVGFPFIVEEIYKICPSPSFEIIDINNIQ